jgi:aminoglycoside/choline kinase family phosphotransferase/dTDP-glucose pyrophosphorylase
MNAMILAAGLGTRLRPHTLHTPKPLFTINQRPVLDLTIERLARIGCLRVIVNTHHLHQKINDHVARGDYPVAITTRYEPEILGTGGGIANIADLWDHGTLLVINGDIVFDIDLAAVLDSHRRSGCPVTMVMHDHSSFNSVYVNSSDRVVSFDAEPPTGGPHCKLAFTGIHALEREVLDFLPSEGFAGIIDAYRRMLAADLSINAHIVHNHYWQDIGTPAGYRSAALEIMAPEAFSRAFGHRPLSPPQCVGLHGDGSDRRWCRICDGPRQLILADHGIRKEVGTQEVDAYVSIGTHLHRKNIAVPRIHLYDTFSGLVFVEDLGDTHLQHAVQGGTPETVAALYGQVIERWIEMALKGRDGFDTSWTYQTAAYDRALILEKEARYFTEAFLQNYLGLEVTYDTLAAEFEQLADGAVAHGLTGFMHRDLQSRNIMLHAGGIYFIDFQGGRLGPLQYDLASLLIDPYVALPYALQQRLRSHCAALLEKRHAIDGKQFLRGYGFCAVTRNLQILGAFAFLTRVKGKKAFEAYIPRAVETLHHNLADIPSLELPTLKGIVQQIAHLTATWNMKGELPWTASQS